MQGQRSDDDAHDAHDVTKNRFSIKSSVHVDVAVKMYINVRSGHFSTILSKTNMLLSCDPASKAFFYAEIIMQEQARTFFEET